MELDDNQMCGYLVDLNYDRAILLTEDFLIEQVGGIEQGAFLIAESKDEEYILLRILQPADLIDAGQRTQLKNDTFGNQIVNDTEDDLDLPDLDNMDALAKRELQKQGYECQVLGTFYKNNNEDLEFGADVQALFSGSKYQVYKPNSETLEQIINYNIDGSPAKVGELSYTETKLREDEDKPDVPAKVELEDFTGVKTAFFGMTRTGKSNSIKVLASALHKKQLEDELTDIDSFGQLIIDAAGEYANPNEQDDVPLASLPKTVVYTNRQLWENPKYNPIRDNLYKLENQKQLIELILQEIREEDSNYINAFKSALRSIDTSDDVKREDRLVNDRKRSILYAILRERGLELDDSETFKDNFQTFTESIARPDTDNLPGTFYGTGRNEMLVSIDWSNRIEENSGTRYIKFDSPQDQLNFWRQLHRYFEEEDIEEAQMPISSETYSMLDFLTTNDSGTQLLSNLKLYHNPDSSESMIQQIYSLLESGHLVVLDLSAGNEEIITTRARQTIKQLYDESKKRFRENKELPPIQIYLEEAHRYFDEESYGNNKNIYVRMAKEGAKMDVGLAYATQEVSSIDERVLSNTANWFVTHINNGGELSELTDYYDFAAFARSIRRVDQQGFSKLLTDSHRYSVPIRISKFTREYLHEIGFKENEITELDLN